MPETEAQALAGALGIPTEPPLIVKGSTITIEPLCINQIADIMLSIDRLTDKGVSVAGLLNAGAASAKVDWAKLILRGGGDFREIIATASSQAPDFVGSLNLLEVSKLAGLVWKVNKDFFVGNQVEILKAFGLEESHLEEIKNLAGSIKSLVTSAPTESPASEASPSGK